VPFADISEQHPTHGVLLRERLPLDCGFECTMPEWPLDFLRYHLSFDALTVLAAECEHDAGESAE